MGKPVTLLERLSDHAVSFGAFTFEVEYQDRHERAFADIEGNRTRIANFPSGGADAKELRRDLYTAAKKPLRAILGGKAYTLRVTISSSQGDDAFAVAIEQVPKLDPSAAPAFTAKQGQYLAYIYNYTKIHGQAPAESDLQRYFRVSGPSIHEMLKTLQRNGLIERTPGQARSIRLLIQPGHLPRLE